MLGTQWWDPGASPGAKFQNPSQTTFPPADQQQRLRKESQPPSEHGFDLGLQSPSIRWPSHKGKGDYTFPLQPLLPRCGRSLKLSQLPPFPPPLGAAAPLPGSCLDPGLSLLPSPPPPLCPGLSPAASRTLPSYQPRFWLLPWISSFSPPPSGQLLGIELSLTLSPALTSL